MAGFYDKGKQAKIIMPLRRVGKKTAVEEDSFSRYCRSAHSNILSGASREAKKYLDSANICKDEIKDVRQLACYYYTNGLYMILFDPENSREGYNNLYKSFYYCEQLGDSRDMIVNIIMALWREVSAREDSVSIKQLLAKSEKLQQYSSGKQTLRFITNRLKASLYKIEYKNTADEVLLDSILFYENKSIELYEPGMFREIGINDEAGVVYTNIARYEVKRKIPDFELINSSIKNAETFAENNDTPLLDIRLSYVKSLIYYVTNELEKAESQACETDKRIAKYRRIGYRKLYADNYSILSKIHEAKGDYKNALEYEILKSNYEFEIRNNGIKKLELQFLAEMKDAEVSELKTRNEFQQKRSLYIILICILLFISANLLLAYFSVQQKNLERRAALEKKAKDDAELKLKLKHEQAEKALLEKYEVLSDFYLKEMELMGKNKALEELESEKKKLDEQVELFARKTAEYENIMFSNTKGLPICDVLKEDMEMLISKRLKDKKDYVEKLSGINEAYIAFIREKYEGNISIHYIKYCICFAIGMEIGEVADCFSIEPASVHGLRYRLKKNFGLGQDDSLEDFLLSENVSIVSAEMTG
jgi:hypothetical protein